MNDRVTAAPTVWPNRYGFERDERQSVHQAPYRARTQTPRPQADVRASLLDFDSPAPTAQATAGRPRLDDFKALPPGLRRSEYQEALRDWQQTQGASRFSAGPGPQQALGVVQGNFARLDTAAQGGPADGVVSKADLQAAADPARSFDPQLRDAAAYLLANPRLLGRIETAADGGRYDKGLQGRDLREDGKLSRDDIDLFLQGNEHLRVLYDNQAAFDNAAHRGTADDQRISRTDLNSVVEAVNANGSPLYSADMRAAARFLLDHPQTFAQLDSAGSDIDLWGDGLISFGDIHGAVIDRQVLAEDPAAARAFILRGDAQLPGTSISDENSIPSEGLRVLAAAALADCSSLEQTVDLIIHMPETNEGVRNQLINATYAEIAQQYAAFLGEESGANWAHWGVWASTAVGNVIRNDTGVTLGWTHYADAKQRGIMADGNLLLFKELAPKMVEFERIFGNDTVPDQAKLQRFLDGFTPQQQQLADGFAAYYEAHFETDSQRKQELTLLGNYGLVQHEQRLVDPALHKIFTELPWWADGFNKVSGNLGSDRANDAVRVSYPDPQTGGRSSSVSHNVPAPGEFPTAYPNRLLDLAWLDDPRILKTIDGYRTRGGGGSGYSGSLAGTYADDWVEYDERLYYIVQDWRLHATDAGLLAVGDRGFGSVPWLHPAG